ncbi:MAG: extracellular solute-binding protein, partial [Thermomicrobiales bacterium]
MTIEFWFGEPPENGPQALADAFMKQYPGIKVNTTRYVNDDTGNTKLDTALQGGTPIDVYMSYGIPRLGQRIRAGVAEELTS